MNGWMKWAFWSLCAANGLMMGSLYWDEIDECRRLAPKYDAELEVRQWDGSRVDLLTEQYAIEVDWAPKWAEGIGQALYYAELTGKEPAVLLLVKDFDREERYVYRCQTVCAKHGIHLFIEEVEDGG